MCVTILSITIAFYGVLVIYLGQQAQVYQKEIPQNLQQCNDAVRSFAYITEPSLAPWDSWHIESERQSNTWNMFMEETWKDSPIEILNPTATYIVNNYTQAVEWDEEARDWLESRNITRFRAHYNLVAFSLHHLIYMIYREFPPSPGEYSLWHVQSFVRSDFPGCETDFLNWADRYRLFYSGISEIMSKIDPALRGLSEADLDSAKLNSQHLEELLKENRTDDWLVSSYQEMIQYRVEMSTYYISIFDSLLSINSSVEATAGAYGSIQRYHYFYDLAFSHVLPPFVGMAVFGVVIPMILLGLSDYIRIYEIRWPWWRWSSIAIISIVLFVVFTIWSIRVMWDQICSLYFA